MDTPNYMSCSQGQYFALPQFSVFTAVYFQMAALTWYHTLIVKGKYLKKDAE